MNSNMMTQNLKAFSKPALATLLFLLIGCATPQSSSIVKGFKRDLDPLLGKSSIADIKEMFGDPDYVETIGTKRFIHYRVVDEEDTRVKSRGHSHGNWSHQAMTAHSSRIEPKRVRLRLEVDASDRLLAWWARSY